MFKGVRESGSHFLSAYSYSFVIDRHNGDRLEPRRTLSLRYRPWWMKVTKASVHLVLTMYQVLFKAFHLLFNPTNTILAKFH